MTEFVLPETKYARSGDLNIAYQIVGEGPIDILIVPGAISHLELVYELPGCINFIQRLSRFGRIIQFDKRGQGLSDRVSGVPSLEERMDDVRAVMDAAGSRRTVLVGFSQGAMLALGVGLKRQPAPAAIVGYSGALATVEALPQQGGTAPAILLVHGDMDEVIPVDAMYIAREQLAQAGLPVEWHVAEGIGHGIDAQGLHLGGAFLKQAFAATAQLTQGS